MREGFNGLVIALLYKCCHNSAVEYSIECIEQHICTLDLLAHRRHCEWPNNRYDNENPYFLSS